MNEAVAAQPAEEKGGKEKGGKSIKELLSRQSGLQDEAITVRTNLDLDTLLSRCGQPILVGSAALGLMVWRDLDVTVVCSALDVAAVVQIGACLARNSYVRETLYRNDSGRWKEDPMYPDGLYLGVRYCASEGADWKIDIWFIDDPDRQPDLAHVRSLPPRLTDESREAILRIKDAWAGRAEYGRTVKSFDIYSAVLDDNVSSEAEFESWLSHRRL
jgi:hypothetical protein